MTRWTGFVAAVWLIACAPQDTGPPEIAYGLEECAHCRMIISEERHAAAAELADGGVRKFDDLGCLLSSINGGATLPQRVWVHDVESGAWLDAAAARFVRDDGRTTPMGSGIVAVANEQSARRLGGPTTTVHEWEGLIAAVAAAEPPVEALSIDQPLSEENGDES